MITSSSQHPWLPLLGGVGMAGLGALLHKKKPLQGALMGAAMSPMLPQAWQQFRYLKGDSPRLKSPIPFMGGL